MKEPSSTMKMGRTNRFFKVNGKPRFRKVWTSPSDVFLPELKNYYQHNYYHADSGFELATTEGLRQCLLTRQWDAGLHLVMLLHQLQQPPFELLWKGGMACLQGKIFEEEEELESNPYLPRKYPRTLLIDYLTALFDLPSSGPFHVLLNYELVLHMVYVHEDPLQAYQFLETFIFSHPYNELPMFLLLMGTLALYLAQLQFTYTSISNKEDTSMVDAYPNLTTPPNISSLNRSLLEFNSDAFRYLKISKTMFTKLTSMRLSSLDFGLYLQQYSTLMAKLMEYYKQIDGWGVEGSGMDSSCEWMHGHSLSEPSSENPLSNSSSTTATEDKLEIFLEVFDFKCSDEKKWKELVTKLNRERERIPDLFKYRRTWWFSFHFSHDESNPILLTYKSIIAYWAIPEVYIHLKKKIWKDFKSVPKELHHLFIKFRIRIRDVVWSYKRDKLQKST